MDAPQNSALRVAPLHLQPLRWVTVLSVSAYYSIAYRIRGWGRLPRRRGPTLLVANHQHEIEAPAVVALQSVQTFSWRHPVFTVSSRRMWEPGFFAERIPWLKVVFRDVNLGPLFAAIGMQPIENELHSRPFVSLAYTLQKAHGDIPVSAVFQDRALQRLPAGVTMLSDLLKPDHFDVGRTPVTLSELQEPYRRDSIKLTREQLETDIAHFETLQRDGATIFLAPEGSYSGDGKMQRLRGILTRLAPLARIWLVGISYDPFVGRRLSMLYHVAPAVDDVPLDAQLKRLRPVTTSALLATWLRDRTDPFTEREAVDAVTQQLSALPRVLFVDPELRRDPERTVHAALAGMHRFGMLEWNGSHHRLGERRAHPQFPRTIDMIAYQSNFHEETLEGCNTPLS
ncbi:MAG: hypothetical protein ACXVAM_08720 [Vulcanimicrobiaceae bacterium]